MFPEDLFLGYQFGKMAIGQLILNVSQPGVCFSGLQDISRGTQCKRVVRAVMARDEGTISRKKGGITTGQKIREVRPIWRMVEKIGL